MRRIAEKMKNTQLGNKERIIWLVIALVLMLTIVLIIVKYQGALVSAKAKISSLEQERTALLDQDAALNSELANLKMQIKESGQDLILSPFSKSEINRELERKGLKMGEAEVIADLLKNGGLIPVEGVLGGAMTFFAEETYVISDHWVLAYFEDGHVGGNMLLKYEIQEGQITWEAVDYYLLGE